MIRQPPAYVPAAIASAALTITHGRRVGAGGEVPARDQRERDDAHRLLGVVRAVGERDEAARDELEPAEDAVDDARARAGGSSR